MEDDAIKLEDAPELAIEEQGDYLILKFEQPVSFDAGNRIKIDLKEVKATERDRVNKIWKEEMHKLVGKKVEVKKEFFIEITESTN